MRGGAQADLVLTSAGWYVVKWKQNPQHRRVLVNEAASAELLRQLGIRAPEWAVVQADDAFLRSNPNARIESRRGCIQVEAGFHFGSKVPVDPETQEIYDLIPRSLFSRVDNLGDFIRVLVFDVWVDNCDGRQAIFTRAPGNRLSAWMIDNGHALGFDGERWDLRDRPCVKGFPLLSDLYGSRGADEEFGSMVAKIRSLADIGLDDVRRAIPSEWIAGDHSSLSRVFDDLVLRSMRLDALVEDARTHLLQDCARSA
jgi:hypothetical protein